MLGVKAMKNAVLVLCLLLVTSLSFGSLSLGLINVAAQTESFSNTPLSGFVGIDVLGIDLRYDFGPLSFGIATPFFMFTLSEDTGVKPSFIIPGIAWYGYVGLKLDLDTFYVRGDIGHTFAFGEQSQLGFSPLRLGVGMDFSPGYYIELNVDLILQKFKESVGKIFDFEIGYRF